MQKQIAMSAVIALMLGVSSAISLADTDDAAMTGAHHHMAAMSKGASHEAANASAGTATTSENDKHKAAMTHGAGHEAANAAATTDNPAADQKANIQKHHHEDAMKAGKSHSDAQ